MSTLTSLLATEVTAENQAEHKAEIAKLREQMTKALEEIDQENTRMCGLQAERERLRAEAWWLNLDQNASEAVLRSWHQSRLYSGYQPTRLFNTPGAGTSNHGAPVIPPLTTNVPRSGAVAQPRQPEPTRREDRVPSPNPIQPQQFLTPSSHFSNPVDNMLAEATQLSTIPVVGDTLAQSRPGTLLGSFRPRLLSRPIILTVGTMCIRLHYQAVVTAGMLSRQPCPAASGVVTRPRITSTIPHAQMQEPAVKRRQLTRGLMSSPP